MDRCKRVAHCLMALAFSGAASGAGEITPQSLHAFCKSRGPEFASAYIKCLNELNGDEMTALARRRPDILEFLQVIVALVDEVKSSRLTDSQAEGKLNFWLLSQSSPTQSPRVVDSVRCEKERARAQLAFSLELMRGSAQPGARIADSAGSAGQSAMQHISPECQR